MKPLAKRDIAAMAAASPVLTLADVDGYPPLYAFRELVGDCMEPFISDGAKPVFSRTERLQAGDVAAIFWAPGKNAPGSFQAQVKQILVPKAKDGTFVYRMFRPYTVRAGRLSDVLAIHKCVGVKRPDDTLREVDFAKMIAPFEFMRA